MCGVHMKCQSIKMKTKSATEKDNIRKLCLRQFEAGKSAAEATRIINANNVTKTTERTTQRWYKKFRAGDKSLEILPRGRPERTVGDTELLKLVESEKYLTVREYAKRLDVHPSTVSRRLHALGIVKKSEEKKCISNDGIDDKTSIGKELEKPP